MRAPSKRVTDAQRLLWAIKPLADLWGGMPLTSVATLLLIATDEGRGVSELARAYGMARLDRRLMSRYIHRLSKEPRDYGPGLDLVEVRPDLNDPKGLKKEVVLSDRGRDVLSKMVRALRD